jgi:ABC-type spermidine/putrescine transport system permease subunit II
MNFGILELAAAAVILFVMVSIIVALEMRRARQGKKKFDTSTVFLLIGVLWVIASLVLGASTQQYFFDNGLFNLGLVVLIAGVIAFCIEYIAER